MMTDTCPELLTRCDVRSLPSNFVGAPWNRNSQPRTMLPAPLIERHLGNATKRRSSSAYYLSRSVQGRSKLTYIKKEALTTVRQQCDAHRDFQQLLAQWRQLTAEVDRLWEQWRQSQSA